MNLTTICYRAGILAADTRGTDDSYHPGIYKCDKLFTKKGDIIATAGEDAPGMVFVDWYGTGKKPPDRLITGDAQFVCLVLNEDGLFWYDRWCRPNRILDEFYAIGSGAPYALGAMARGASAKEAVEIAMKWDPYTGGEVQTLSLLELPELVP